MESKGYKILIACFFGTPGHVIRFIRNLKQANPAVSISLFSERDEAVFSSDLAGCLEEYFQRKKHSGWPKRVWRFRGFFNQRAFFRQIKDIAKSRHYDIVNIHFPQYFLCGTMRYFRKMADTIVVSPWGSDVLRVNDSGKKRKLARVLRRADYITVASTGLFGKVLHQEMGIEESKFHPLAWGSETIDYINNHQSELSREDAKERLGLGGRYLITCGYNAFAEQRHETIIKAIKSKRNELPANLTLLFPVSYGNVTVSRRQDYVEQLRIMCQESDLPSVFYTEYLSVPDVFLLRCATDMFIHIQSTDGGNSSLQEYVLCGAKVVHGAWIHYSRLEQYAPLFYYPVKEPEELGDVIVKAYESAPIQTPNQVMDYIRNRGWKAKMQAWNDFFMTCIND